jgi:membrane protease YdiL (CAAX protease family)
MLPTPAGWFPDPWNSTAVRFWDGRAWTAYVAVPSPAKRPPHPTLPSSAAWGAVATLLLSLIASRYLLKAIAGFGWPIAVYVSVIATVGYVPALVWCWYASRRWGTGRFRSDVGLGARWVDAGWGPVTWGACLVTEIAVAFVVVVLKIPFTSNVRNVSDFDVDRGYVVSLLVLAVLAAPIAEEIVFRGVVLRGLLSRSGPVMAVGLQGLLFGFAHFDPVRGSGNIGLILVLSSVGCVLGGAAFLFRRLAPTMIAHAILNGIAMALALSGWFASR